MLPPNHLLHLEDNIQNKISLLFNIGIVFVFVVVGIVLLSLLLLMI